MQKIDTLSSLEGRRLLHSIFREMRYQRQLSNFRILYLTLIICIKQSDLKSYSSHNIQIQHLLGLRRGFSLWMEEIVNRFFFSSVLSLVYFGAAFLILIIGLNRFTEIIPTELVIVSVAFESSMLIVMFITMVFSPNDDSYYEEFDDNSESTEELLLEIGEIGRDLASVVVQLEKLTNNFENISSNQEKLIIKLEQISNQNESLIKPNSGMLDEMKELNLGLISFKDNVSNLNQSLEDIKSTKVNEAVRSELQKIISDKLKKDS